MIARLPNSLLVVALLALTTSVTCQGFPFFDDFGAGKLDPAKWKVSNWHAPGDIPGRNRGRFSAEALDFSQGMLRIGVTQGPGRDGSVQSVGGELQSRDVFGYGTYEFVMRLASTADTPNGEGGGVSGSDSGAFIFINNSESEIDIEFLGGTPDHLWLTNWVNSAAYTKSEKPTRYQQQRIRVTRLAEGFHRYAIVWTPGEIVWRIDGKAVGRHTRNVPVTRAHIMISHWGTNNERWGGRATLGMARYLYVQKVTFAPTVGP